ncbi:MAG: 50S ribosomal protein L4 [Bacilli bacterium]
MPKITMFDQTGKEIKDVNLADEVFGIEPNKSVLFDAIIMQRASLRQGTHKVKNRSEVRGGGRKPWRQKGTGNARQGTIRAPQWRGGGVVFGPTPRSYSYKLNKKVRRLALRSALSLKVLNEEIKLLDAIKFDAPKTKEAINVLNNLDLTNKVLVVSKEYNEEAARSFRNIPKVAYTSVDQVNVLELTHYDNLLITEDAANHLGEVLS